MTAIRNTPPLVNELPLGDDEPTDAQALGFTVTIGGAAYDSVLVTNNGVMEFSNEGFYYYPDGLPGDSYTPDVLTVMAPHPHLHVFWADIDTRPGPTGTDSGHIRYGTVTVDGTRAFVVLWDDVRFYQTTNVGVEDHRNRFQWILWDRPNLSFELNYDQITWDTGTASGGLNTGRWDQYYPFEPGEYSPASVGWWLTADDHWQKDGSYTPDALLDSNPTTGLTHNSYGSPVQGRYAYNAVGIDMLIQRATLSTEGAQGLLSVELFHDHGGSGTTLTENFDGGTDGATVTTSNTIFEDTSLQTIFTSATAHSGTLSATAGGSLSLLAYPMDYEAVSTDQPASGVFWFRYTGTSSDEDGFFALSTTPQVGDVYGDVGDRAVEFVKTATGLYVRRYTPTVVEEQVTLPAATWLKAEWAFTPGGTASFFLRDAADTVLYSFVDQPVVGTAFGFTQYYLNKSGGFQNWLDDVSVSHGASASPIDVLIQRAAVSFDTEMQALLSIEPFHDHGGGGAVVAPFGQVGRHEGKPENGNAVSFTGYTHTLWSDSDLGTFTEQTGAGFEDPWGHPAAQMLTLPMTPEDAAQVEQVKVTWSARVSAWDPSKAPYDECAISPFLRIGKGETGYAGPNYHSLAPAVWWGDYSESLYDSYEDTFMPVLGQWYTFSDYLVPIYTDRTLQQILSHDLTGTVYNWPGMWDETVDPSHTYLITYQESFWSEEYFQIGEVVVELIGPGGSPVDVLVQRAQISWGQP